MAEQTTTPEAVKQCTGCKKPVKKLRRYYRHGKYYCSENCYRKNKANAAAPAESAG